MASRLELMLGCARPHGFGLEIGALDSPLLRKADHDLLYVDYATTEVIRANQYDPNVRVDEIVEVDVVWGGRPLAESVGRPADYVVASHVIEHVPDLIGWLLEIAEVLRPGGVLGLAVPDKRFTFDALRRETVLADVVEAYLLQAKRPSLRQVFDVASLGVGVDAASVWDHGLDPAARRGEVMQRLRPALGLVRELRTAPRYQDAHCWVFTPDSFLDLAEELQALDLFPFRIEAFHPTPERGAEFYVRLAKAEAGDSEAFRAGIAAARDACRRAAAPPRGEALLLAPSPRAARTPLGMLWRWMHARRGQRSSVN
jgi:SAM-dependent methyltransferase